VNEVIGKHPLKNSACQFNPVATIGLGCIERRIGGNKKS
jgi:hypothetical protein